MKKRAILIILIIIVILLGISATLYFSNIISFSPQSAGEFGNSIIFFNTTSGKLYILP